MTDTLAMLDAFASVGTEGYTLTLTDITRRPLTEAREFRHIDLAAAVPTLLDAATRGTPHNVIIRPRSVSSITLIQLDDLKPAALRRVAPLAFLTVETSPGNFQAWLALDAAGPSPATPEPTQDLIRRLVRGVNADPGANGSVRLAGSRNVKASHAPDFPVVRLYSTQPGLRVTSATLDISGLAAPPEPPVRRLPSRYPVRRSRGRGWPDYQRCLDGAPPNHENTGPDTSRADYTWCIIAARWGWPTEQIAAKLVQVSPKAQNRGERYAELTAAKAAAEAQTSPSIRA